MARAVGDSRVGPARQLPGRPDSASRARAQGAGRREGGRGPVRGQVRTARARCAVAAVAVGRSPAGAMVETFSENISARGSPPHTCQPVPWGRRVCERRHAAGRPRRPRSSLSPTSCIAQRTFVPYLAGASVRGLLDSLEAKARRRSVHTDARNPPGAAAATAARQPRAARRKARRRGLLGRRRRAPDGLLWVPGRWPAP